MAKAIWLGMAGPDDPIYKEGWSVAVPWRPAEAVAEEARKDEAKPEAEDGLAEGRLRCRQ